MPTSTSSPPLLVLVADDDDDLRASVIVTLRDDGCSTLEARDGAELLVLLDRMKDHPSLRPDVILADIKMPKLSGLGVLDALKRGPWRFPVVMMTALKDSSIDSVAVGLGAVSMLHKPFAPADLLSAVHAAKPAVDRLG